MASITRPAEDRFPWRLYAEKATREQEQYRTQIRMEQAQQIPQMVQHEVEVAQPAAENIESATHTDCALSEGHQPIPQNIEFAWAGKVIESRPQTTEVPAFEITQSHATQMPIKEYCPTKRQRGRCTCRKRGGSTHRKRYRKTLGSGSMVQDVDPDEQEALSEGEYEHLLWRKRWRPDEVPQLTWGQHQPDSGGGHQEMGHLGHAG